MNNFNMPTPAELAKEETKTVSLRIKQSTSEVFERLATEQNSKPATMMAKLLEMYAESYRKEKD